MRVYVVIRQIPRSHIEGPWWRRRLVHGVIQEVESVIDSDANAWKRANALKRVVPEQNFVVQQFDLLTVSGVSP